MRKWDVKTPFPIVSNNIEYIGITLAKEIQVLEAVNYKTLLWDIKEDLERLCSWNRRLNIV